VSGYYVRIDGIPDADLEMFGFELVAEDDAHKLYRDPHGDAYIVTKDKPFIFVEDVNDAMQLGARSGIRTVINSPD
tara:strand:+ start:1635 stop:1862 length:228 start_codon:yes stop_codon:yes gene_type:complete